MQKTHIQKPAITLIGIKTRTSYQMESNPASSKLVPCVQQYFQQQLAEKIANRKNPGVTICVYTEYESDYTGAYTFFIGEEVDTVNAIPDGLNYLNVPGQSYSKFTTEPGAMPQVVISAWQKIWAMPLEELGGERLYQADFEIYDQRAKDPNNTVLDIYIGVK